ncbi:MAG: iron-sulfur cluster biosynthesis family protein, partial [Gemmatimonadaceae bacterium]
MAVSSQPEINLTLTPAAGVEVQKFMEIEKVSPNEGGLRVSIQPGGCSGFKYSLLIEDKPADDDLVLQQDCYRV